MSEHTTSVFNHHLEQHENLVLDRADRAVTIDVETERLTFIIDNWDS